MSNVEDKYKPKNITQSKRRDISPTASSLVRRGLDELQAISSKHIRLLIVDNDPFTRYQLGNLVCSENDIEVVGEAGDGVEGLYWFYKLHPDVVCVRSHMQRLDGLAMTHILSERFPGSKVLIYGVHDAQEYYEQSIYAGAQDYLELPSKVDIFSATIRRISRLTIPSTARVVPYAEPEYGDLNPYPARRLLLVYKGKLTPDTNLSVLQKGDEIYPDSKIIKVVFIETHFQSLKQLEPLCFRDLRKSSSKIPHIAELDFMFVDITDDELNKIIFPEGLGSLNLLCTNVGEDGCKYIHRLDYCNSLNLRDTFVDKRVLSSVFSHKSLRWLDLSGTGISDQSFVDISRSTTSIPAQSLTHLVLDNNRIYGEMLDVVIDFPSLRWLSLRGNPLTKKGIQNLIDMLTRLSERELEVFLEGEPVGNVMLSKINRFNNTHRSNISYISNSPPFSNVY